MNQILVTKKLYITPELKRKKKIYKFDFILSIFLVCILVSLYIYAEYDRNKSEEVSQTILAEMNSQEEKDNTIAKSNVLVVVLSNDASNDASQVETTTAPQENEEKTIQNREDARQTSGGYKYVTIGTINIPKINVSYPILEGITAQTDEEKAKEIEELLKISPSKFWGPNPNEIGNLCIVGHNYRNKKFFSKVPTLVTGDIIEITANEKTIKYSVYDKYTVIPEDNSCTSQLTGGRKEITLITCTDDSKQRFIVKAREI